MTSEELASCKEEATIQFRAEKLDKKDLFGKSDPFFIVSKSMPNGQVRANCPLADLILRAETCFRNNYTVNV